MDRGCWFESRKRLYFKKITKTLIDAELVHKAMTRVQFFYLAHAFLV